MRSSSCAWRVWPFLLVISICPAHRLGAQAAAQSPDQGAVQTADQQTVAEKIQNLSDSIARTQSLLDQSQRQLDQMRKELGALEGQLVQGAPAAAAQAESTPLPEPGPAPTSSGAAPSADSSSASADDLHERETLNESQIATLDQEKVESESKYPVRVTGMVLFNGFVNTSAVDAAATPAVAIPGAGSTGASMRQTILGFDARGPHLFGARSFGDLRVDFNGSAQSGSGYASFYSANSTFLRLRTAHAGLLWSNAEAYFALDRPIVSPDAPSSLTAVAEPPLAWSGNLWTWNPQFGARRDLALTSSSDLRFEAALTDVGDAPLTVAASAAAGAPPVPASGAEQSRWPGLEARIALLGAESDEPGNHLGVGGYFAPHHTAFGNSYDAWAGTLDAHLLLPARLQMSASFYRGLALGGLGAGAYKDFVYRQDEETGAIYLRPLSDVGGWSQLKEKINARVELNAAFGIDNAFAGEVAHYAVAGGSFYENLARNRTYTGNVIFTPSAFLLFSLEYRHIASSPVDASAAGSNIIGLAAGYKF
jgi:uncharacterized coiled-coil protein SlyX